MPSADSNDAMAIAEAMQELKDAILWSAALSQHTDGVKIETQTPDNFNYGMKLAFEQFQARHTR